MRATDQPLDMLSLVNPILFGNELNESWTNRMPCIRTEKDQRLLDDPMSI